MKLTDSITTFHQQIQIAWIDKIKGFFGFKAAKARTAIGEALNRVVLEHNVPIENSKNYFQNANVLFKTETDSRIIETKGKALIQDLIKDAKSKAIEKQWSNLKNSIPSHIYQRHPESIKFIESFFEEASKTHDEEDAKVKLTLLERAIGAFEYKLGLEQTVLSDAKKVYVFVKKNANALKSDETGYKLGKLAAELLSYQFKKESQKGLTTKKTDINTTDSSIERLTELKKPHINEMFWKLDEIEKFCKENKIDLPKLRVGQLDVDDFIHKEFYS